MRILPCVCIIIPVYNAELYIERCIRSIAEQDIPDEDFEIIVVNDGSIDRSKEIVIRLQNEISNIVLVNQNNLGVSSARNTGLKVAKGEYVLFIDADDYVAKNTLGNVIKRARNEALHVLYLSLVVCDNMGRFFGNNDYSSIKGKIFNGIDAYHIARRQKEPDPDRSCGIIYKVEFLKKHNFEFLTDMPYLEDGQFVGKILCLAENCAFDSTPFYFRTSNPGSASNSNLFNTSKARQGFISAAEDIHEFVRINKLSEIQLGLINHLVAKFILTSVISAVGSGKLKHIISNKNQIRDLGFQKLKTIGVKGNVVYTRMYNFSYWLFIFYFFFEMRIKNLLNILSKQRRNSYSFLHDNIEG